MIQDFGLLWIRNIIYGEADIYDHKKWGLLLQTSALVLKVICSPWSFLWWKLSPRTLIVNICIFIFSMYKMMSNGTHLAFATGFASCQVRPGTAELFLLEKCSIGLLSVIFNMYCDRTTLLIKCASVLIWIKPSLKRISHQN